MGIIRRRVAEDRGGEDKDRDARRQGTGGALTKRGQVRTTERSGRYLAGGGKMHRSEEIREGLSAFDQQAQNKREERIEVGLH